MKLKLKKGLNLDLAGKVTDLRPTEVAATRYAVVPDDFPGFVPKLAVAEDDEVAAGAPLLHDKVHEQVAVVSPVAGRVAQVVRGARRKIERVVVEAGEPGAPVKHDVSAAGTPAGALELLCKGGMLARMRQRPYDIVPNPEMRPRDIFVTGLDTAPLSPGIILPADNAAALEAGVKLLGLLTEGKVYVSLPAQTDVKPIPGAEMVTVEGPHPAGNVGVQIANIAPVSKGETVWTLDILTLYKIGHLALTGEADSRTLVAVTGSDTVRPCMLECREGAEVDALLTGNVDGHGHHVRIISGNVLTGVKVGMDGFLRFPYRQITVIPEGDDVDEFMGWASLSPSKMSVSPTFPGHFFGHGFKPDARILGGRRAMIMSGEYDKVMPMDIMTEYLVKAILGGDIEGMENLGIYEVAPEDVALCEYVDSSKMPLQQIVRSGLDSLRKELE